MVGLLIYVKKHCIRPEKIGKDTNPLIFQTQLILVQVRMAKDQDQDQVPVFNVVGGSGNRQRGSGVVVRSSVAARNTVLRVGGAGRTARPVS